MTKLVTLEAYRFVAEAEIAKVALEEEGLRAYLADDNLIAMDWLLMNAVGGVKLQVASEDESRARQVLQSIKAVRTKASSGAAVVFDCENCGKSIQFPAARRGGVETCKHCGKYVDVPE